ncbi:MAG: B12-binding domain-containing radical SAM protein [Bdellovibrio sp.]|nr:B12-binding domain-containing radical SAM protein [Bdellovibrio sp.]
MKILLIQPPVEDYYDTDIRLWPLGLAYIKGAINYFHPATDVVIRDYHAGHGRQMVSLPPELQYLREYYLPGDQSPFCTFTHYYRFGASAAKIVEDLNLHSPDVVGISCNFTPYFRQALEVAKLVKKVLGPHVMVIMGGAHVSAVKLEMLRYFEVDFIIYGEAERPMVEWMEWSQGKRRLQDVSALGYRENGVLKINPSKENFSIDDLPIPSFTDLPLANYKMGRNPMAFMLTSRGCPHQCSFCSVHTTFGPSYRKRSTGSIIEEIELRYRQGFRVIDFEDDNLTFFKDDMKQLMCSLINHFPNGEMEFVAMNGLSYLSLDEELLSLMKKAGFTQLNLSLVTSDESMRATTKRPHTVAHYKTVIETATRLGLKVISYQILGLPGESLESIIQTLCFHAQYPVLLGASNFYLTPGSPVAEQFQSLTEEDYVRARLSAMAITKTITREEIYTLFIITRLINFLKGLSINSNFTLSQVLSGELYQQLSGQRRIGLGLELLAQLLTEKKLYFATSKGKILNNKFKVELFLQIWGKLDFIRTMGGQTIVLSEDAF